MRSFRVLALSGVLFLSACSESSDENASETQENAPVVTEVAREETVPIDTESDQDLPELCPTSEAISSATGLSITEAEAVTFELDGLGTDPASGAIACTFLAKDRTFVTLTRHGSPIETQAFLDMSSLEGVDVSEFPSGAIRVQFEGQASCEFYDGQVSVAVMPDSDSATDACEMAAAAAEAAL